MVRLIALMALLATGGCATHWERAFYEGQRANQPCTRDTAVHRNACPPLPSYDEYERARVKARGAAP
jgi:hypothetical protein